MGFASPGRYQLLASFLLGCIQLPVTFTDNILELYSSTQMHRCRIRYNATGTDASLIGESMYRPLVERQGKKLYSSCEMYVDPTDHSMGTQPCIHGWEYINGEEEWTLVTEWNLVCEREYMLKLLPYIYYSGTVAGCVLFGFMGDHLGRRTNLLLALLFHTGVGIGLHFATSFTLFAVGYSLQGVFCVGMQCLCTILLLETISYPYHLKSILAMAVFTPVGTITLSVLAWLIRNWRYTQVAVTSPGIVCIGYFWLIPRSLPWLLVEGRLSEAESQLLRFARFNKTLLPQNFRLHLQHFAKAIRSYLGPSGSCHSLETVTSSSKIRRYTFTLYCIWFVVFFDSSASSVNVPDLEANKYALLFVNGLMDLGMVILLYFMAHRFGPRFIQATFLIIGGALSISSSFLEYYLTQRESDGQNSSGSDAVLIGLIPLVLASIGKTAVRSVVPTLFFFSIKVYPTGIRSIGVCFCLFWGRSALLLGHYVSSLDIEENFLPKAVSGTLCVIGGCLSFLLPISTRRPLPNVSKEVEQNIVIDGGLKHSSRDHFQNRLASTKAMIMNSVRHNNNITISNGFYEDHLRPSTVNKIVGSSTMSRRTTSGVVLSDDTSIDGLVACYSPDLAMRSTINSRSACQQSIAMVTLESVPGPSSELTFDTRQGCTNNGCDVGGDNESRLTDLEDELTKIWGIDRLTVGRKSDDSAESSLRDFIPRSTGDIRNHFHKMNETSF